MNSGDESPPPEKFGIGGGEGPFHFRGFCFVPNFKSDQELMGEVLIGVGARFGNHDAHFNCAVA